MFDYLSRVIDSGSSESSKRFALVVATLCLGPSAVGLAVAAAFGANVADAMWAVTTPLAGMAGVSYVGGKFADAKAAAGEGGAP